jgi:hypothetical protein
MLKGAFSTLSSVVGASVKGAVSDYTPTAANMGGAFTRIAQQGIANLSYRSPILADVAATMLHSFQSELIHRDKVRSHVSSEDSNALRAAVTEKLGPDTSKEKVDAAMTKVIDKMSKIVDAEGMEAAKKSDVFKEFGEYFKNFKKPLEQPQTQQSGGSSDAEGTLGRIDVNTSKTAQLLAEMVPEGGIPGAPSQHPEYPHVPGPTPNPGSFIDPMTGLPSIKAAVGSIGGTFLGKVFDDAVITKYANKTKSKLFGVEDDSEDILKKPEAAKPEPVVTPKRAEASKERQTENIQEILKGISLDLSKPALPESFAPIVSGATPSVESLNEANSRDTKRASSANNLLEQIVDQLKKLNDKKSDPAAEGSGLGLEDVLKSKSKVLGKVGNAAKLAARFAGPAALVASAGAAGYGLGTMMNPLIDKGITAASGEENSLGTWLYNKTHSDEGLEATKSTPPIAAAKSKQIAEIEKMQSKKDEALTKQSKPTTNPVVLNTPVVTNNNSTTVIATASVRNQESTFERVQFQDFWRRVA